LVLAGLAVALTLTPGAPGMLSLDRVATLNGEWWRLLTGHWVHGSAYHLWWDVLPLLALGFLYEPALGRRLWSLMLVSTLTVGVGVLALNPGLPEYLGLSGALNGLWIGGSLYAARLEEQRDNPWMARLYRACVIGGLVKIAVEAATGTPIFTDLAALGGSPVPLAHALGALAGILWLWKNLLDRRPLPAYAVRQWSGTGPARPRSPERQGERSWSRTISSRSRSRTTGSASDRPCPKSAQASTP
jgi:rhomboid family GlyGly-CTERM serine protease